MNRLFILSMLMLSSTNSIGQDAKTVVEKYFESVGGRDRVEQLKTSVFNYKSIRFYPKSDTFYFELKKQLPKNEISSCYYANGKLRYQSTVSNDSLYLYLVGPFPKTLTNYSKKPIFLDPSTEILQLYRSKKLKYSEPVRLNGIEYQVLKTDYPREKEQPNKIFYFDSKTGLLAGEKVDNNVTIYKDYRVVNLRLYPFIHEQYLDNTLLLSKDVYEEVKFNINLSTDDFKLKLKDTTPLRRLDSEYNKVEFVESKYSNSNLHKLINNFQGKRILIDIWATWCGSCKTEFTKYDDNLYDFLKDMNIELLFISVDKPEKKNEWMKDLLWFNLNGYHIIAGEALSDSIKKEINGGRPLAIPRYILINENGEILSMDMDRPSSSEFRGKVSQLFDLAK